MPTDLPWRWLGCVPYGEALDAMRTHRAQVVAGDAPEQVWLLEHPPVVTTGKRGATGVDHNALAALRVPVVATERGGLATYHGPGQLVVWPLVNLMARGWGVRSFVFALEQALIDWLGSFGVQARRRPGAPGVWVGSNKVAALGLHIRRGVSGHGLAVNLTTDLAPFRCFVPCGIEDGWVTSLAIETGDRLDCADAAMVLGPLLAARLGAPEGTAPKLLDGAGRPS